MRSVSTDSGKPVSDRSFGEQLLGEQGTDPERGDETVTAAVRGTLSPVPEGQRRFLVAVSGGVDSMVLLHAVSSVQEALGLELVAAHVNHQVRDAADEDQRLVERFTEERGIPLEVRTLAACPPQENFEAWARSERYGFFSECLSNHDLSAVLVAHHAEDQLETFLMRLLSNKEPTAIPEVNRALSVRRPLLSISKEEIRAYAEVYGVPFSEDATNTDTRYLRNRVRQILVPFIEQEFGEVGIAAMKSQAAEIDQRSRALDRLAREYVTENFSELPFGGREWFAQVNRCLASAPRPFAELVLRALFRPMHENPLGSSALRQLYEFFRLGRVAVQLSGRLEVRRRKGGIAVSSLM